MKFVCFWLPMTLLGWQPALARDPLPRAAESQLPSVSKIYGKWCSDCHSTPNGSGSMAIQRKYQGAVPAILNQRTDLTTDYVNTVVRKGISFMPSFRKTEISDAELALLANYLAPVPGTQRGSSKSAGGKGQ